MLNQSGGNFQRLRKLAWPSPRLLRRCAPVYRRCARGMPRVEGAKRGDKHVAYDLDQCRAKIMDYIRSEIQDKELIFDLETPLEGVKIDSIDVIHVIFKVEEEFGVAIDLDQTAKYEKVGDFVDAIIKFIPMDRRAS